MTEVFFFYNCTERPRAILTLQPDGQIFNGQDVTFTCEIQGYADTEWTYNWNKNNNQIFSYTENRKYSFTAVESASGKYTCSGQRKNDSQTSETSNAITLTVSGVYVCVCVRIYSSPIFINFNISLRHALWIKVTRLL